MDSGGFTELTINGEYTISEEEYLEIIKLHKPHAAYCQDYMCEPEILEKTGKTIKEHQELTVKSYISLRDKMDRRRREFPVSSIRPVLQGWTLEDYLAHIEMYKKAGVRLYQVFGLGTMCSRSSARIAREIIEGIKTAYPEIGLHAFGLKITALKDPYILYRVHSADSMAWSLDGRFEQYRNPHKDIFKKANNRLEYALRWRDRVLRAIEAWRKEPVQQLLFT
jgi:hypothetical protein